MSSRNVYLPAHSGGRRKRSPERWTPPARRGRWGQRSASAPVAAARAAIDREPLLRADYVALVGAHSLEPATRAQADAGAGLLLVMAVFAGATRLIDNTLLGA